MEPDTIFVKNGRDIFLEASGVYWLVTALIIVYSGLLVGQWVTVMNIDVTHTYFSNPGAPGVLLSYRYSSPIAIALELMCTRIFLLMCIACLIIYRKSFSWTFFWLIFVVLLFGAQVYAFFALTGEYINHNKDGNRYGLAADPWFCCAKERHDNPLNYCVNIWPCGGSVPTFFAVEHLRPNLAFIALFWVNCFLFLLDVAWMSWILYMWNLTDDSSAAELTRDVQDEKDVLLLDSSKSTRTPFPVVEGARAAARIGHGIRNRK